MKEPKRNKPTENFVKLGIYGLNYLQPYSYSIIIRKAYDYYSVPDCRIISGY